MIADHPPSAPYNLSVSLLNFTAVRLDFQPPQITPECVSSYIATVNGISSVSDNATVVIGGLDLCSMESYAFTACALSESFGGVSNCSHLNQTLDPDDGKFGMLRRCMQTKI